MPIKDPVAQAEYMKVWRAANKEKINARTKEYRNKNKDLIAKQKKEYYLSNKKRLREASKKWEENNLPTWDKCKIDT